MKPLPWDAINSLQAIQSIENMFVLIFLIIFTSLAYKKSVLITNKWLLFLIFSLTIYGLVIVNIGTSARYRYPFILTYVIGLSYELYKMHNFRFNNIFKIKF